ncbi:MAG TPA: zinc ribbon domain-containing protein [Terracidiphilus sp.]
MEITCNRCHQAVPSDGLYCPNCGLPQLVYSGDESATPNQANAWTDALLDGGAVEWKPALRAVLLLAVPAGLIFGGTYFLGLIGVVWIAAVAAWAVTLYVRGQRAARRPFWLTTGAGARIGLVTGLIAGWLAFAAMGATLYLKRFAFHQGGVYDNFWQANVAQTSQQLQQISAASQDPQATGALFKLYTAWMATPEGRAGLTLFGIVVAEFMIIVFAVAGGALGAKLVGKQGAGNREQGGV